MLEDVANVVGPTYSTILLFIICIICPGPETCEESGGGAVVFHAFQYLNYWTAQSSERSFISMSAASA